MGRLRDAHGDLHDRAGLDHRRAHNPEMKATSMNLNARFKPRADASVLSRHIQDAWAAKQRELLAQSEALGVAETVAAHLESRYPAADMAVLRRYGQAKEIESIGVRAYNPRSERWDVQVPVELPRPVWTPGHYGKGEVYTCGPRYSREENRGLRPEYRATLTPEKWAEYCADQDAREAASLPESVEPFFAKVVSLREAYQAEYRQASEWPAEVKSLTGAYPTWGEIAEAFPVLGAHLQALVPA